MLGRPRLIAGCGAALGWAALGLQLWIIVFAPLTDAISVGARIVNFFSFFTVLTNILVAIALTQIAMTRDGETPSRFARPSSATAIASYIAIVGIVYSLVLRELWAPQGAQLLADRLLHDVMPAFFVLYWLVLIPRASPGWMRPVVWLAYPLLFLVWTVIHGRLSNWYPYPFVDLRVLSAGRFALHVVALTWAFLVFGWIFVAVDRLKKTNR